jgi:hypothetical protein
MLVALPKRNGGEMAVGVLQAAPEFTKQIYDGVTKKVFGHASPIREDEAPEGLIAHSAGQGEQGYYVYDIWESREAFERFMEEKLGPRSQRSWAARCLRAERRSTSRSTCSLSRAERVDWGVRWQSTFGLFATY